MKNILTTNNQRASFAASLYIQMSKNKNIWVITGDLGYGMWDKVRGDFPSRFINTGASEQSMMGIGVGLALEGKIPFVYSITTFLLYRPFETIRDYINHERIPVKLIGSGRDKNYLHDGISHWPLEDKHILKILKNIKARWPEDVKEIPNLVSEMIESDEPWYINLKR